MAASELAAVAFAKACGGESLSHELVKDALKIRTAQVKRLLVRVRDAGTIEDVTIVLARVSSPGIAAFFEKRKAVSGVTRSAWSPETSGGRQTPSDCGHVQPASTTKFWAVQSRLSSAASHSTMRAMSGG